MRNNKKCLSCVLNPHQQTQMNAGIFLENFLPRVARSWQSMRRLAAKLNAQLAGDLDRNPNLLDLQDDPLLLCHMEKPRRRKVVLSFCSFFKLYSHPYEKPPSSGHLRISLCSSRCNLPMEKNAGDLGPHASAPLHTSSRADSGGR